jgi:hypothetical protein
MDCVSSVRVIFRNEMEGNNIENILVGVMTSRYTSPKVEVLEEMKFKINYSFK